MVTAVVVLPSIYPPYLNECLETMSPEIRSQVMVIDNSQRNRGVACSWNAGAHRVLAGEADWLVSLSAATRFGAPGGSDFLEALERFADRWVVETGPPTGWHCIGWSKALLDRVGFFDENFWPAYGEDADMSHRILMAIEDDGLLEAGMWEVANEVDATITMQGHGERLTGISGLRSSAYQAANWEYCEAKWGSRHHRDSWAYPFNDPSLPAAWWPRPPNVRINPHDGWSVQ